MTSTSHYEDLAEIEHTVFRFADCSLPCVEWTHQAHLTVGLWYLREHGPEGALDAVRTGILQYNAACGTPNSAARGYHETLTRFYLHMIGTYLAGVTDHSNWVEVTNGLIARYGARDLPLRYYSRDRLMSSAARADWVPPDLQPLD